MGGPLLSSLAQLGQVGLGLPSRSSIPPDYGYGPRWDEGRQTYDGPPKALGYFGPLKNPNGDVMSEFSIDETIDGRNVSMPSLVPTLTKDEVQKVLREQITPQIRQKAVAYARQRLAQGLSPFAGEGEQSNAYPELPRAAVPQRNDQQVGLLSTLGMLGLRR